MPIGRLSQTEVESGVTDVRLLCFNADETGLMLRHPVKWRAPARWTIGVWYWETDNLPRWMQRASPSHVDEVWAGSSFTARAIPELGRPSTVIGSCRRPYLTLPVGSRPPVARSTFGLPDGHLFFFEFDYRSVFERKNPIAVVEAFFCHTFSPGERRAPVCQECQREPCSPREAPAPGHEAAQGRSRCGCPRRPSAR